jgi:two-component system OmpR family sensor kinase
MIGMSIRSRILGFQLIVALSVVTLAATALYAFENLRNTRARITIAYEQLQTMMELAVHANRFSEQIAEKLLLGSEERSDFEAARNQVYETLRRLQGATYREIAIVPDNEAAEESQELGRADQLIRLFGRIERATERIILLDKQGNRDEAIAVFRDEIENRLDRQFDKLINDAVADERLEVKNAESAARQLINLSTFFVGLITTGIIFVIAVTGSNFLRSITRPVAALTAGARQLAGGNLGHRTNLRLTDEFGLLSKTFDAMASSLAKNEEDRAAVREELESRVASRTAELALANKRLSLLDQQRIRFLADASHELRTPLTALRGEAEVALRKVDAPAGSYRAALDRIVQWSGEMTQLVDDLMFLARSDSDEIRLHFREVSLPHIVQHVVQSIAHIDQGKRIALRTDGDSKIVVHADRRRLSQVVLIVIDNALKYAIPETPISVSVTCDPAAREGLVTVRDCGPGIPPAEQEFLFNRFFRGTFARIGDMPGSGLGLSIAKWIIDKHEGRIMVDSSPNGTSITIVLPLNDSA